MGLHAATVILLLTTAQGPASAGLDAPELRVPIEHWGCANCHRPDETNAHLVDPRPGPDLDGIGGRVSADWLRRWIGRPADLRAAPTMPRLFGDSTEERADLEAVVHWLASLGEPAGGVAAEEEAALASGRELYHQVGCVNCHGALDAPAVVLGDELLPRELPETFVFSAFSDLSGKWRPAALAAFLRDPGVVHRDGRMPRMELSDFESDALANYLLSKWGAAPAGREPTDDALAARGREVFSERGCQACHVVGGLELPAFEAPSIASLAGKDGAAACLSSGEWDGPRYDFPAPALARMFAGGLVAAARAKPADPRLDFLERRIQRLNCRACHEIAGQGGIPDALRVYCGSLDESADLGDEGRFPPHLNDAGAKLTTSWFAEVLQGGRARPYLATRMPTYGEVVEDFPELFARRDGVEPGSDDPWPVSSDEAVLAGRELMGMQAGACVSCHSFKDYPATGTPGPDMAVFAERLRYAWWKKYIRDPAAKKPGTRMPSFLNEGESVWPQPFDGDFERQTDAMWSYFALGEAMPTPPGVERGKSLVLEVGERPRVFRTFLESAGSRGIAVGTPLGIHYAWDAALARLTEVWQGEFLDASGAWAGRGGNSRGAPGEVLWADAGGAPFVIGKLPASWPARDAKEVEFLGYRIEDDGYPRFGYRIGRIRVEESIQPMLAPTRLLQQLEFEGLTPGTLIWLRSEPGASDPRLEGAVTRRSGAGSPTELWATSPRVVVTREVEL